MYEAIKVTTKQLFWGIFDVQLLSVLAFYLGYLVGTTLGVSWIWNVPPLKSAILLVLRPHGINLSPTLADTRVGVAWQVASVRCQVAVRSGEWQVSGVRWRCECASVHVSE